MNMRYFRPHQPYLPPRTITKIAVASITYEVETPDFGPVALTTWCLGPTVAKAVAEFTRTHSDLKILHHAALAGANLT